MFIVRDNEPGKTGPKTELHDATVMQLNRTEAAHRELEIKLLLASLCAYKALLPINSYFFNIHHNRPLTGVIPLHHQDDSTLWDINEHSFPIRSECKFLT